MSSVYGCKVTAVTLTAAAAPVKYYGGLPPSLPTDFYFRD